MPSSDGLQLNQSLIFDTVMSPCIFDAERVAIDISPEAKAAFSMKILVDKFDRLEFLSHMYQGIAPYQEFLMGGGEVLVYHIEGAVCRVYLKLKQIN